MSCGESQVFHVSGVWAGLVDAPDGSNDRNCHRKLSCFQYAVHSFADTDVHVLDREDGCCKRGVFKIEKPIPRQRRRPDTPSFSHLHRFVPFISSQETLDLLVDVTQVTPMTLNDLVRASFKEAR